jgi:chromosome segregation ATPase
VVPIEMRSNRREDKRGHLSDESHPVYSDFSHVTSNVENASFAVGLREENGSRNIERILPLTKIIPAKPSTKRPPRKTAPKKQVKVVEEEEEAVCPRPDCSARRLRLADLQMENEHLRSQFKMIENKVIASKHKKALAEKNIAVTEEKNDNIRAQIDETQGQMESLQAEIGLSEISNKKLREKLSNLESEILLLKEQADHDAEVMRSLQNRSVEEMVFAPKRYGGLRDSGDAEEVRTLRGFSYDDDDSDG